MEDRKQTELKAAEESHKKQVDELQKTSQANVQKAPIFEAVSMYIKMYTHPSKEM